MIERNSRKMRKTVRTFVSDMIKRGKATLRKNGLPSGKIMSLKGGVWMSRDTQTGKEKVASPEEMTTEGNCGVDMPVVHNQDEPPRCTECGSYKNLRPDQHCGWICETCIQLTVEAQDKAQENAKTIKGQYVGTDWSADAKKDGPIQSEDLKEDE